MNAGSPFPPVEFFHRFSNKFAPGAIEEIEIAVWPPCVDQCRGRIKNLPKTQSLIIDGTMLSRFHGADGTPRGASHTGTMDIELFNSHV
jgi:hypothetical protein